MKFHFSAINLGCNKNMVDLEYAIWEILKLQGTYDVEFYDSPDDEGVEYVIVNTCWFLSSSREESENTVSHYDNLWKKIIVMGCYIPVENDNFLSTLKNLYATVPFINYSTVEELVTGKKKIKVDVSKLSEIKNKIWANIKEKKLDNYLETLWKEKAFIWKWDEVRAYFNAAYGYEYLKISEGCDNNCSFCIIPKIRGKQRSRAVEDILKEVEQMVSNWVKEIQILSQDTTRYGTDIYDEAKLFELLEKINDIPLDFEMKVFYLYPDVLTLSHLKKLKKLEKVIPYFDIPFQHISPTLLKRMGRFYNEEHIRNLLDFIRSEFTDSFIHTNFIIWFPGETEEDFKMLLDFIEKYAFESISFFEYHDEPLAASSKLDEKVPHEIAVARLDIVRKLVEKIYKENFEKRKGRELLWYIMDFDKKTATVRWKMQAPEVDEYDVIPLKNIISGNIDLGEKVVYMI